MWFLQKFSLLGSTGSIGTQTLDIVREHSEKFEIVALAAGRNLELIAGRVPFLEIARKEFQTRIHVIIDHSSKVVMNLLCPRSCDASGILLVKPRMTLQTAHGTLRALTDFTCSYSYQSYKLLPVHHSKLICCICYVLSRIRLMRYVLINANKRKLPFLDGELHLLRLCSQSWFSHDSDIHSENAILRYKIQKIIPSHTSCLKLKRPESNALLKQCNSKRLQIIRTVILLLARSSTLADVSSPAILSDLWWWSRCLLQNTVLYLWWFRRLRPCHISLSMVLLVL